MQADYTFLNDKLAKHYGIPGVSGPEWRRVENVKRSEPCPAQVAPQGPGIRIGRSNDVEAVLQAPSVAKEHAKVVTNAGRTFVIDQNSKNGTWIHTGASAQRLPPGVPEAIGPGEELIIAGFFRFRLDGQ